MSNVSRFLYCEQRLQCFIDEQENWDGAGGLPTRPEVGQCIREFLQSVEAEGIKEPGLGLGNDGSVAVVWQTKPDIYITADFCDTDGYTYLVSNGDDLLMANYAGGSPLLVDELKNYLQQYFSEPQQTE